MRKLTLAATVAIVAITVGQVAEAQTLGAQMQTASQDLTTGGGFILELFGYILGAVAILYGVFTLWQYTKNPNGQHKMGYAITSIICGGFFLAASTLAQMSANTVSGANATNTGTSQQFQIQ